VCGRVCVVPGLGVPPATGHRPPPARGRGCAFSAGYQNTPRHSRPPAPHAAGVGGVVRRVPAVVGWGVRPPVAACAAVCVVPWSGLRPSAILEYLFK